jgi:predicted phosphoribosyltransferase
LTAINVYFVFDWLFFKTVQVRKGRAMVFANRAEAGRKLAQRLKSYRDEAPVILALPRGGVIVGAEIAQALRAPLDVLMVRKIGVPGHEELAMGAVVDGAAPTVFRNESLIASLGISDRAFDTVCQRQLAEIERRKTLYRAGAAPADIAGRTVILVDDGLATGATARVALEALAKQRPARVVLAVPIAPHAAVRELKPFADAIVCLESRRDFTAVGCYFKDFSQVEDADVVTALARANRAFEQGHPKPATA